MDSQRFQPTSEILPLRESVAYSGYVVPSTGEFLMTKPSCFNFGTLIQLFRKFIDSHPVWEGERIYLVLGNAPDIRKQCSSYRRKPLKHTAISMRSLPCCSCRHIRQISTPLSSVDGSQGIK